MPVLPDYYQFDLDLRARQRLRDVARWRELSRFFIEKEAEPWISSELMGAGVKLSERQFPYAHQLAKHAADTLGIPCPQVFVRQGSEANSFAHGVGSISFVVITHSLFEQLDDEGLSFVLGHEMGHIASGHAVDATVIEWLRRSGSENAANDRLDVLRPALDWMRKSEITADRAGLIVGRNLESASRVILTLTLGSMRLASQVDLDDYVESQTFALRWNPVHGRVEAQHTHPFAPLRIHHLRQFAASDAYREALAAADDAGIEIVLGQ
ncbi:MAG: M48 family metallopeptidase [Armatimonadota bacterium]